MHGFDESLDLPPLHRLRSEVWVRLDCAEPEVLT
jgi:hypothetical protein